MIDDLWDEAKHGDWLAGTVLVIVAFAACVVLWVVFYFADSSFLPERPASVEVVGLHHSPGHFQSQVISNGSTTTTTMIWIPDSWTMSVSASGGVVSCPISEKVFRMAETANHVTAQLVTGRFSGKTYCNGILGE